MTKADLKAKMDQSLDNFSHELQQLDDYGQSPITEGGLKDLSKQVFYVLNDFKNYLLEYLN